MSDQRKNPDFVKQLREIRTSKIEQRNLAVRRYVSTSLLKNEVTARTERGFVYYRPSYDYLINHAFKEAGFQVSFEELSDDEKKDLELLAKENVSSFAEDFGLRFVQGLLTW